MGSFGKFVLVFSSLPEYGQAYRSVLAELLTDLL